MITRGELWADITKMALTFVVALGTGIGFLYAGFPAPYLMGSLFGVWAVDASIPQISNRMGVARWIHIPVILGLGVLIGSNFTADILSNLEKWFVTVTIMAITTIAVTTIGFVYLRRVRKYDKQLAFLCSIPGGQAEAIVVARDLVEKDYVVALFHLIRVAIVFCTTPLLLGFVQGQDAVYASNTALQAMPSLFDLSWQKLLSFLGTALFGYLIARLLRLPMAHLFGPLCLSTALHMIGILEIPRVNEFVILAQVVIGGAVGARLAWVPFRELLTYVKDAFATTTLILTAYILVAVCISMVIDTDLLAMWLAFVPGGLYEVTLLALIFSFDVAFITFHHTIRVMLIFLSMPLMIARLGKG